jgi:hypothetical protein
MRRARTTIAGVFVLVLLAGCGLGLAGCGLGAGATPSDVALVVTSEFGAHVLPAGGPLQVKGEETAMSLLERNYRVIASNGGGFVQSIDGHSGGQQEGQPLAWFYYVNGVEATKGAAATDVRSGDRIWWDRHDWSQTESIPAVVGSFPEPFVHGIEGKRVPVRVECASLAGYACRTVTARLRALGVAASATAITSTDPPRVLRVLVAPWLSIDGDPGAEGLLQGPRASGVYARFSSDGRALTLLDQDGRAVQTLHAGGGLIAATRQGEGPPVWLVTGTDGKGVQRAAGAFDQSTLRERFAVALGAGGATALPDSGPSA